jgi:hypothetical protein
MNYQIDNRNNRLSRFRRWLHYLVTIGMLLQMLPAPVAFAAS